jgi:hypothetical protein
VPCDDMMTAVLRRSPDGVVVMAAEFESRATPPPLSTVVGRTYHTSESDTGERSSGRHARVASSAASSWLRVGPQ